ncbi:MAG: hypothetical protein AB1793_09385 [Candidatus Thermoplasmatota archaeon]
MTKEDITRPNTVEKFFKTRAQVAVAADAKDLFVLRFNELAEVAAGKAISLAKVENAANPLIRASHLVKAFEGLGYSAGGGPVDPGGILTRLHQMSPEQIAELVRLIRTWLAAQPA